MTQPHAIIGIVAIGSTGDVVPYLGVGNALAQEGFDVVVATHEPFRDLVTSAGLQFHGLPMDPRVELTEERAARMRHGTLEAAKVIAEAYEPWVRPLAEAIDRFADRCDGLLLSTMAWTGIHSAAVRGLPSMSLHLQPLEPSRELAPALLAGRWVPRIANHAFGVRLQRLMHAPHMGVVNDLRGAHGLAKMTANEHLRWLADTDHLGLHGWSPSVLPRPSDWRAGLRVVGYWWPPATSWTAPDGLLEFLDAGSPPVYIGFGSASPAPADELAGLVREAVVQAKVRAVVLGGWAKLGETDRWGDGDVLVVESVPNDWLFPRVAAVVHHGGSGTTGAALRAGVAAVPVPVSLDQPFWAHRAHRLGVATAPIRPHELSAQTLGDAIRAAVSDGRMRSAARGLSSSVVGDRGAEAVVAAVRAQLSGLSRTG